MSTISFASQSRPDSLFTSLSYDWWAHSFVLGLINIGEVSNSDLPNGAVPTIPARFPKWAHACLYLSDIHLGESSLDPQLCIGSFLTDANKQLSKIEMSDSNNFFFFFFFSFWFEDMDRLQDIIYFVWTSGSFENGWGWFPAFGDCTALLEDMDSFRDIAGNQTAGVWVLAQFRAVWSWSSYLTSGALDLSSVMLEYK